MVRQRAGRVDLQSRALAVISVQDTGRTQGIIPETGGELLVEAARDEAKTGIFLDLHIGCDELQPVQPLRGILVRRRAAAIHGWYLGSCTEPLCQIDPGRWS